MSTRYWPIFAAAACAALALTTTHAKAANEAAGPAPLWKGFVPDDAFLAVVANPRRALAGAALPESDFKSFGDDWEPVIGFSPLDLEQVVILTGPMVSVAEYGPYSRKAPEFAIICRLSKDFDQDQLSKLWFRWPEKYLVAGHRCFRQPQTEQSSRGEGAACFFDNRTFVYAGQNWLPALLRASDAESKLITALGRTDMKSDLTMIFASTDGSRGFAAEIFPERALPPPLKPLSTFPDLITAAKLAVQTSPEIGLKLTVVANDESSANQVSDLLKSLQQIGQQVVPRLQQFPPRQNLSPTQRESRDYEAELAKKFVDQFVPQQTGKYVTVDIGHLGTAKSFFDKIVMPPMRAEWAAEAAAIVRTQNSNNFKLLASAMLVHAQSQGTLPLHAIYSKDGKPLLSWRVAVLPDLGLNELYKKFHLDEPWDSDHNKALIAQMPNMYRSFPGKSLAPGQTRYVVPVGEGALFDGQKPIALKDITDGIAETVEIVQVGPDKAVTWTKPDDLQFDPEKPLAGLGTIGDYGIPVAFANCSTTMVRKSIDPELFRWLILRADGHTIDHSKL